jgi:hypothetical protein
MRQVVFAACLDREVAYEENLQGDFTRCALPILQRGEPLTNERFQEAILTAFGAQARQHPLLDCAGAARPAPLFGLPPAGAVPSGGRGTGSRPLPSADHAADVAQLLEAAAAVLRGRG